MSEVLSSWKEIANYLGKGVRTVQRWENELGLPVYRPINSRKPTNSRKGVVIAYIGELQQWSGLRLPDVGNSPTQHKSHQTRELAHNLKKRSAETLQLVGSLSRRCETMLQAAAARARNRAEQSRAEQSRASWRPTAEISHPHIQIQP
jgi:hypothetical protein